MKVYSKNVKILKKLDWSFIILGLTEIYFLYFFTSSLFVILLGIMTITPAFIALNERNKKWDYFVGIFAIARCNPFTWIFILFYIVLDSVSAAGSFGAMKSIQNGLLLLL